MRKLWFPIAAYVVSCPTYSKNLEWYLIRRYIVYSCIVSNCALGLWFTVVIDYYEKNLLLVLLKFAELKNSDQKSKFLSHYYIIALHNSIHTSTSCISQHFFWSLFLQNLQNTTTWPFLFYRQFFEMTGGISCLTK